MGLRVRIGNGTQPAVLSANNGALVLSNLTSDIGNHNQQWSIGRVGNEYRVVNRHYPRLMLSAGTQNPALSSISTVTAWVFEEYINTDGSWGGRYSQFPEPGSPVFVDVRVTPGAVTSYLPLSVSITMI